MILAILVILVLLYSQNMVIGYKTVYEYGDPVIADFKSLDDAMEYAELKKTGWRGGVDDFYKWKEDWS